MNLHARAVEFMFERDAIAEDPERFGDVGRRLREHRLERRAGDARSTAASSSVPVDGSCIQSRRRARVVRRRIRRARMFGAGGARAAVARSAPTTRPTSASSMFARRSRRPDAPPSSRSLRASGPRSCRGASRRIRIFARYLPSSALARSNRSAQRVELAAARIAPFDRRNRREALARPRSASASAQARLAQPQQHLDRLAEIGRRREDLLALILASGHRRDDLPDRAPADLQASFRRPAPARGRP